MNNKGFAITGIIYTLFIIFLMILLSVIAGLRSYQKLMVNSVESLESNFEGTEITGDEFNKIKTEGIAKYTGKYIFTLNVNGSTNSKCSAYLYEGFDFKTALENKTLENDTITLSPRDCNDYSYNYDGVLEDGNNILLSKIYSFEGAN